MATFSPSPAPRRGRLGHGTPPGVGGRLRNPSARATSRLATPAFAAQNHDSSSLGSGMDIDEEGNSILSDRSGRAETLLAKSEEMSVALHAILPTEVKQTLKKAGECILLPQESNMTAAFVKISLPNRLPARLIPPQVSPSSPHQQRVSYGSTLKCVHVFCEISVIIALCMSGC